MKTVWINANELDVGVTEGWGEGKWWGEVIEKVAPGPRWGHLVWGRGPCPQGGGRCRRQEGRVGGRRRPAAGSGIHPGGGGGGEVVCGAREGAVGAESGGALRRRKRLGSSSGRTWGDKLGGNGVSWAGEFGVMAISLGGVSGPEKAKGSLFRAGFCPEDSGA